MIRFAHQTHEEGAFSGVSLLLLAVLLSGCASTIQLPSRWAERPLPLDGDLTRWADSTVFTEKDGIRVGVMNDEEYFYLCMISSKPNIGRQLVARGMTVWFDPHGGNGKILGVRFPLGMGSRGMMGQAFDGQTLPERGERQDRRGEVSAERLEREVLNEFEFLGPAPDDLQRVSRLQGQGLEMHLTLRPERFVYQLRVPLKYSSRHPYALETTVGSPLGVAIETNPFGARMSGEGNERPGGETGGAPTGGGRPGAGGRTGQRPGGMNQTGGRSGAMTPVTLDIKFHVQLADKSH